MKLDYKGACMVSKTVISAWIAEIQLPRMVSVEHIRVVWIPAIHAGMTLLLKPFDNQDLKFQRSFTEALPDGEFVQALLAQLPCCINSRLSWDAVYIAPSSWNITGRGTGWPYRLNPSQKQPISLHE